MDWFLDDGDVRLAHGDAAAVLRDLPAASVQTCVTSPPYWGLRDYGTGEWTGGDEDCGHVVKRARNDSDRLDAGLGGGHGGGTTVPTVIQHREECPDCGARRVDDQLGLEPTPDEYVTRLVSVFREVRRVLRDDGTLWLNLGDSYAGTPHYAGQSGRGQPLTDAAYGGREPGHRQTVGGPGLKPKDLVGIPWRVAFALQADGWYLRSDIIWAKPNPMPESVTDRPTKAHEYVFLLTKQPRYFWDADAIREGLVDPDRVDDAREGYPSLGVRHAGARGGYMRPNGGMRNARSVWQIATQPTPEAHFATFPEELARRCILAGTSEAGGCAVCGAPWQRQTSDEREPTGHGGRSHNGNRDSSRKDVGVGEMTRRVGVTLGWAESCACDAPARPQTVLDPFAGSGTTCLVARHHARHAVGIDLSAEYLGIASRRLSQLSLLGSARDV